MFTTSAMGSSFTPSRLKKKKGKKDFTELGIHISSAAYFCHDKGLFTP